MEMNKAGQNCQEEPDGQIIEKTEQRCVNDSDCCRRCGQVSQEAPSHFPADPLWHRFWPPDQLASEAEWISVIPATSSIRRRTAEKSSSLCCASSSELPRNAAAVAGRGICASAAAFRINWKSLFIKRSGNWGV